MRSRSPTPQSLYASDGRRKYLTPAERRAFIRRAEGLEEPALATLCLVLAHCGCRLSEALALRAVALHADDGIIAVRSLKKRGVLAVRQVPVPSGLIERLCRVHGEAFASGGTLWTWSRCRAWKLVKTTMIDAGVTAGPHQTARGLRHAFGVHAVRCGVPLNMIQRWLGHASLATTAIYTQAVGPEERELAARMWTLESDH